MLLNQKLPKWAFNADMHLIDLVFSEPNAIGERRIISTIKRGPFRCAKYPTSARIQELSELDGVRLDWEVYTEQRDINPQNTDLRINGQDYKISVVDTWEHFSVLGVYRIEP